MTEKTARPSSVERGRAEQQRSYSDAHTDYGRKSQFLSIAGKNVQLFQEDYDLLARMEQEQSEREEADE